MPPVAAGDLRVAPNPFNPRTEIRFALPADGTVTIAVYDVAGRRLRTLDRRRARRGSDRIVSWDGRDDAGRGLPSGAYLVRVEHSGGEDGAHRDSRCVQALKRRQLNLVLPRLRHP